MEILKSCQCITILDWLSEHAGVKIYLIFESRQISLWLCTVYLNYKIWRIVKCGVFQWFQLFHWQVFLCQSAMPPFSRYSALRSDFKLKLGDGTWRVRGGWSMEERGEERRGEAQKSPWRRSRAGVRVVEKIAFSLPPLVGLRTFSRVVWKSPPVSTPVGQNRCGNHFQ